MELEDLTPSVSGDIWLRLGKQEKLFGLLLALLCPYRTEQKLQTQRHGRRRETGGLCVEGGALVLPEGADAA